MAVQKLGADEYRKQEGLNRIEGFDGRAKTVVLISESGLYKLIMRSDKPQARAFQEWVTRHVLPAIRKDGAYVMGEEKVVSGALTTLNTNTSTLTMSSREIAELTGKRHDNVVRDIRNMLEALGEDVLSFEQMSQDSYGRPLTVFNLPKDLTITLVSGYNVQMRYAITKRWMELEAQQAPKLPTSFAEALRLAAELEEQKEQLRPQNESLKPAATITHYPQY